MSQPAAGRADFQQYASWLGTPAVNPATSYPVGTTVIEDLNLANYAALNVLAFDVTGNGRLQFQFFTDSSKSQSVDVYQFTFNSNTVLNLTIPMISPFVEISVIVDVGQTFNLITIFTPNNTPVVRPTYPGRVRDVSAFGLVVGAGSSNTVLSQYIIGGNAYLYFDPADAMGKLDFIVNVMDNAGNVAYELAKFKAPTGPMPLTVIVPPAPLQIKVVNNDGAAPHTCNYTVQLLGD